MFGKLLKAMLLMYAFERCGGASKKSNFVRVSNTIRIPYLEMSSRSAKGRFACAALCSDDCWYLKYQDDGSGSGTCDLYSLRDTAYSGLKFVNISNLYKKVQPNASKYFGMPASDNWQNAQNACQGFGAKMATAETASKLNAIRAVAEFPYIWLGARRNESGWFWLSGVAMATTPVYYKTGDCLYLMEGNQVTENCTYKHYWVCEIQF